MMAKFTIFGTNSNLSEKKITDTITDQFIFSSRVFLLPWSHPFFTARPWLHALRFFDKM
jgi:hypothetical protein